LLFTSTVTKEFILKQIGITAQTGMTFTKKKLACCTVVTEFGRSSMKNEKHNLIYGQKLDGDDTNSECIFSLKTLDST